MMSIRNQAVGRFGEKTAARHLEANGYTILERNWRCPDGEIDIVAHAPGGPMALVEVKTRTSRSCGHPAEAITPRKLARMRKVAAQWRHQHRHHAWVRLDVLTVDLSTGQPQIWHIQGVEQ